MAEEQTQVLVTMSVTVWILGCFWTGFFAKQGSPRNGFAVSSFAGCPPSHVATARQPNNQPFLCREYSEPFSHEELIQMKAKNRRGWTCMCPQQPSTELICGRWMYIAVALKCLFLVMPEADVALGQLLPLPKHQLFLPRSKRSSSLMPFWEESQVFSKPSGREPQQPWSQPGSYVW